MKILERVFNGLLEGFNYLKTKLKALNIRRIFIKEFPYTLIYITLNRFTYICVKTNFWMGLSNLSLVFGKELPILPIGKNLIYSGILLMLLKFSINEKKKNAKKYRTGEEYGSARWGTRNEIQPYIDTDDLENNIILTKTESLTMQENMPREKVEYNRNKNVLVIGGSGSGKTRFYVKPNLMQQHSSYVVTDPKGSLIIETGKMLMMGKKVKDKDGKIRFEKYKIKVFNTINFKKSMHYNPFSYVHSEKDVLKLVNTIMLNTKGEGQHSGDDFWLKAEKLLYNAFISYIVFELKDEDRHFGTLLDMINNSQTQEENENYKNLVDVMFEELDERKKDCFAVRQYKKYKLAAGKTAKSILISCGARLAPFDIEELKEIMSYDELELDKIGDRKTALFIIISDTDTTFNFVVAMLYTQLFNLLCDKADDEYGGKLPIHVRCLLDEFSNIGQIPNFDKLIATIRSRRISASVILQAKSQLKNIYKDNADTIIGNCDTTLFLGGSEKTTLKDLEETIGKETIDLLNTSENRGRETSAGTSYQKTGRSLMSQDEIAVMKGGKCILQIRGTRPFYSDKYDIFDHSRYNVLSDYDRKNESDIEAYLGHISPTVIDKKLRNKTELKHKEIQSFLKSSNITITEM